MSYSKPWGSSHPGCVIFLVDQSGSMTDPFGGNAFGAGRRKMDAVATVLNNCINEMGRRCVKGAVVSPRVHVAVIGYGGDRAKSVLPGALAGKELVPINELMENPLRVENRIRKDMDDTGQLIEYTVDFPVWVEPVGDGATPMTDALELARRIAESWIPAHRDSFPPIVINITDGQATDGDPSEPAWRLRQLETDDGNVLLFNCHISETPENEVLYPAPGDPLPRDTFAQLLFDMSSELPDSMRLLAMEMGVKRDIKVGARGFVYNTDVSGVTKMIQFATVQRLAPEADMGTGVAADR